MRIQSSEKCPNALSQGTDHWSDYEFPSCPAHCPRLVDGQELWRKLETTNQNKFFFIQDLSLDIYFSVLHCFLFQFKEEIIAIPFSHLLQPSFPSFRKTAPYADLMTSVVLWVHFYCKSLGSESRSNQDPYKPHQRNPSHATHSEIILQLAFASQWTGLLQSG